MLSIDARLPAAKPRLGPAPLQLLQFSRALTDFDARNTYFFRLADAERAHAPESLDEVKEQVASDVRVSRAYKQAREQAHQEL